MRITLLSISALELSKGIVLCLLVLSILALIILLVSLKRALWRRTDQLVRSEQAFWGMVHDLKTPLAAAYADLSHLAEQEADSDKAIVLEDSAERISQINDKVKRLLKLPKLFQDGGVSVSQRVKLMSLLLPIESELEVSFPDKLIAFIHNIQAEQMVVLPMQEVEVLLRIVLENAVRYSGDKPYVTISLHDPEGQCALLIQDNGPGMWPEASHKLIELRSYNLPKQVSGHGIGLMYAVRLAEDMGARLMCKSTPQGSSVVFVLRPNSKTNMGWKTKWNMR